MQPPPVGLELAISHPPGMLGQAHAVILAPMGRLLIWVITTWWKGLLQVPLPCVRLVMTQPLGTASLLHCGWVTVGVTVGAGAGVEPGLVVGGGPACVVTLGHVPRRAITTAKSAYRLRNELSSRLSPNVQIIASRSATALPPDTAANV